MLLLYHPIHPGMTLFPGTPEPSLSPLAAVEEDGFAETGISLTSHTGTHLDAPAHLFPGGNTLDQLDRARFAGEGWVIDCTGLPPGSAVTWDWAAPRLNQAPQVPFLLFYTGWDRFWGTDAYKTGYPTLDPALCRRLAQRCTLVGVDTLSPDPVNSSRLPAHRALLEGDVLLLENLTGLSALVGRRFWLAVPPLLFPRGDGAPAFPAAFLPVERS